MVVIQIKQGEHDTFLYETTCSIPNDQLIREIVKVWNLRLRIGQLIGCIQELAKYGPMKKPENAGIDSIQEKYNNQVVDKNENYLEDPSGIRNGCGPGGRVAELLQELARDADSLLSKDTVTRKIALSLPLLKEKMDTIRGAVTMAYPMGLPEWDTIRIILEAPDDLSGLEGTAIGQQILDENTAELWIASRCLDRNQYLSERLGKNEKTKVVGKLQKAGGGAPGREPVINEEEKKAMMAYYFKKQEELKQLAENDEDSYLNSSWADSKQLQKQLRGQNNIRAPGIL